MTFVFLRWRLQFNTSTQGAKIFFSHLDKVQFLDIMEQICNDKAFRFISRKIKEVLKVELVNSIIKKLVGLMIMVEFQDINKLVEFIKISSLDEHVIIGVMVLQNIINSKLLN
jgi:hypothetical protein